MSFQYAGAWISTGFPYIYEGVQWKPKLQHTGSYIYMGESSGNPNSSILEAHRQMDDRPSALFCHLRLAALSFPPRKNFQARYYFSFCFALIKVYVSSRVT